MRRWRERLRSVSGLRAPGVPARGVPAPGVPSSVASRLVVSALLMSALVVSTPGVPARAQAQQPASADALQAAGEEAYTAKCSFCHDRLPEGTALAALPGVASLSLKYGGAVSPYIRERANLANAAVLQSFLRNGSGSMPPFRKTELTDEEISAIAAYFAQTSTD